MSDERVNPGDREGQGRPSVRPPSGDTLVASSQLHPEEPGDEPTRVLGDPTVAGMGAGMAGLAAVRTLRACSPVTSARGDGLT